MSNSITRSKVGNNEWILIKFSSKSPIPKMATNTSLLFIPNSRSNTHASKA